MSTMVIVSRRIPLSEATAEEKVDFARRNRRFAVLKELAQDECTGVKLTLFSNPNLPIEIVIDILQKDKDEKVQEAIKNYWERMIRNNKKYLYIIKTFFSETPNFSDKATRKAITALFFLISLKYNITFQDEFGDTLYFSAHSRTANYAFSSILERKMLIFEYLYSNSDMSKLTNCMVNDQDLNKKLIDVSQDFKKWFEKTKRPENKNDIEWLIMLGEFAILDFKYQSAGRRGMVNKIYEELNVKNMEDNPYKYAYEALRDFNKQGNPTWL